MLKVYTLILILFTPSLFAELVVVVAKDSDITQLDESTVQNIFLSRTNRYPDGSKAKPIEYKDQNQRNEFYTRLTGKSPKQLSAYWTSLIFSGKGKPPKKIDDVNSLVNKISNDNGFITYMNSEQINDNVKVVYSFK